METKRFQISTGSILWQFILRFTVSLAILPFLYLLLVPTEIPAIIFPISICALLFVWLPFLKNPYKIVIDYNEAIFKSFLRTVRMELKGIISIDMKKERYTRVKSRKKSVLISSRINKLEELIEILSSTGSNIKFEGISPTPGEISPTPKEMWQIRQTRKKKRNQFYNRLVCLLIILIFILVGIPIIKGRYNALKRGAHQSLVISLLKNAADFQVQYFVDHQTYADSIEKLDKSLSSEGSVAINVISADKNHYKMEASHKDMGGKKFVIIGPGGEIEQLKIP